MHPVALPIARGDSVASAAPVTATTVAPPGAKTFYIESYGCQMNEYDASFISATLKREGYAPVDAAEAADLILLNTCAVRDHAEERVLGRIGELRRVKDRRPGAVLAVAGCMAQRMGRAIADRAAHVDLVLGTDSYRRLPDLLSRLDGDCGDEPDRVGRALIDIEVSATLVYGGAAEMSSFGRAFVSIMQGCNSFCTFCIVPLVRGRERSKSHDEIISEVRALQEQGAREVTLLGQKVNAYRWGSDGPALASATDFDFADLLRRIDREAPVPRVRFTSSHPRHFTSRLLDAMADCESVCENLHLPVQSGSLPVLRRMRRLYTPSWYLDTVSRARERIPGLGLSTDIIVGFPGETDADFEATLTLMEAAAFDSSFLFKYSPRPETRAFDHGDTVPEPVKSERLERALTLQKRLAERRNRALLGRRESVLIESANARDPGTWLGRLRSNKSIVLVSERPLRPGDFAVAEITACRGAGLLGAVTGEEPRERAAAPLPDPEEVAS
jgi:tRNA-2-methylthio-N6-dimethylallyladenosine synthase